MGAFHLEAMFYLNNRNLKMTSYDKELGLGIF